MNKNLPIIEIGNDEKILWQGIPKKRAYMFSSFTVVMSGACWFYFWLVFLIGYLMIGDKEEYSVLYTIFVWTLGFLPSLLTLLPIYKNYEHKNVSYIVTNIRIVIRSGLIFKKIRSIDLDSVIFCQLKYNYFDLRFDTGSIEFFEGKYTSENKKIYTRMYSLGDSSKVFDIVGNELLKDEN